MWSFKTGGLSGQWSLKTGFTVEQTITVVCLQEAVLICSKHDLCNDIIISLELQLGKICI